MKSVPASKFVNIIPGVIGAGGNPLSLNGILLTQDASIPLGGIKSFSSSADVTAWFGGTSIEAELAGIYFSGMNNSFTMPGTLHIAQFNTEPVAAWLRGGSVASMKLETLAGLSGTLTLTVDGVAETGTISLAGATSFSDAAAKITAGLDGAVCAYDSRHQAFVITSPTTGAASAIGFASGTLAAALNLMELQGAQTSQGADPAVPADFMTALLDQTQNWASFFTAWEPPDSVKIEFANWVTRQNERYLYIAWDSSAVPATNGDAPGSFGRVMKDSEYDGVYPVWPDATEAAFIAGLIASIDFNRVEGRVDPFFKGQSGTAAKVTDSVTYDNLTANGYNFRAAVATANDRFVVHVTGQMPGKWLWLDSYVNQINLNAQLQLALIFLFTQINSIPHNEYGRALLRQACQDPINQAVMNGTIRIGIELSNAQKSIINSQAGLDISRQLYTSGYYLQVLPATAQERGLRHAGPMTLWYTDGGGVHSINMPSINIQ